MLFLISMGFFAHLMGRGKAFAMRSKSWENVAGRDRFINKGMEKRTCQGIGKTKN